MTHNVPFRRRAGAIVLVLFLVVAGAACAADPNDSNTAGAPGANAAGAGPVAVSAFDLGFDPDVIEVPSGTPLQISVTNDGAIQHDLRLDDAVGSATLDPGASETVDFGVLEAPVTLFCSIPGHREAGMEIEVSVGGAGTEVAAGAAARESAAPTGAEIDFDAEPAEDWTPRDPTLAPAEDTTEHEILMSMDETVVEVAPGVTQEMWTFNGTYPGPVLRGKVGDTFTVTVRNDGEMAHSIDFHASLEAWDDEMRELQPGEELTYEFTAEHSGIYMYHCGAPPALHHIGNGMHGAIIIDPPDLAPVDHEFVLVQSEIYTGPEGGPGSLDKMINEQWDAITFNGYVNQYRYAPIRVEPEERVRVWVVDNGPSENSSFHVVGTIFDTSYKEGAYLLQPGPEAGGSQALDLQPAQGGFVEFELPEPGLYPMVTHKFANVGKGALGLFQAGEVPDREDDGVVREATPD
jgi:nitrite reductase (NO-forming)